MIIIAAADRAWGIGKDGDLLYNLPDDMRFFREKTAGKTVVMGRATLQSFPNSKPLPKRRNIVISKTATEIDGAEVCKSPEEVAELLRDTPTEDVFVIGGESIYREMLPYCDTAYVTRIEASREADRHLVNFDELPDWELTYRSPAIQNSGVWFSFVTYKKVR